MEDTLFVINEICRPFGLLKGKRNFERGNEKPVNTRMEGFAQKCNVKVILIQGVHKHNRRESMGDSNLGGGVNAGTDPRC
jgi:hypothetical protein